MKLRPYQEKAIAEVRNSFRRGNKRTILQLATGGGKTLLSSVVVKQAIEKGSRVLVIAPRRELVFQFHETLRRVGVDAGMIMSGVQMKRSNVQIASFDTFTSWVDKKERMRAPKADLVIIDETHVYLRKQIEAIKAHYQDSYVIGLTATPTRKNGTGLGVLYDDMVLGVSIRELTEQGYLSKVRYFAPSTPDLEKMSVSSTGDYSESTLDEHMNKTSLVGDIVENWARIAGDRQTVVFCSSINHSVHVRDEFLKHGVKAEHLDGKTDSEERRQILERVANGETQVLTNVFVATYGLDIPSLSCAVMARPTKNIALYLQMVGRIMRVCEGKEDAIVIDHAGVVQENGMAIDDQYWSLDTEETIRERTERKKAEKKEKKDIQCDKCKFVYKAERQCPNCGHEWELWGKEVPYIEADLEEINPAKENREKTWEYKIEFIGGLKQYARDKGFKDGWWQHKYKEKFGVWPNDKRVRDAKRCEISEEVSNYIKYINIRNAKMRERK